MANSVSAAARPVTASTEEPAIRLTGLAPVQMDGQEENAMKDLARISQHTDLNVHLSARATKTTPICKYSLSLIINMFLNGLDVNWLFNFVNGRS